ncbi:hypothetical protein MMU07_15910 [Aquiflexum sp. LQ15W]|uniref:hypothetical protein n=1 Tax=Cognataquiflexum nitidum TaxID=2922272 RepID=UPI001F136658|nr:hypothetical protein [Cognataquiflexum nitidum]MCH6201072.1 hypothetical protein [Cognataquiflexum nitidum]
MKDYSFKETQKFNQLWIWIPLVLIAGIVFFSPYGLEEVKYIDLLIPMGIIGLVFALFLSMVLKTTIDTNSLAFSYFPFIRKRKYNFKEIESMELKKYNSPWEYGGWGIRYNFDSWAYNTGGKFGILVKTKDKKFLLGTHKPEEAKIAIGVFEEYKSRNHGS